MNTKYKVIICGLMTATMAVSSFTGCGTMTGNDKPAKTTTVVVEDGPGFFEPSEDVLVRVDNEDIFETGYYSEQAKYEFYGPSQKVSFRRLEDRDINWYVYLLDEEVKDLKDLEDLSPSLVNEGDLVIVEGQWIYIQCDCNSATAEEPSKGYYSGNYFGA